MNGRDSSGFRFSQEDLEFLRVGRFRWSDFRGATSVRGRSGINGTIPDLRRWSPTLIAAYANLEPAVSPVEFAESLRAVSGHLRGAPMKLFEPKRAARSASMSTTANESLARQIVDRLCRRPPFGQAWREFAIKEISSVLTAETVRRKRASDQQSTGVADAAAPG
jgi:hypothetical protein